MLVLVVTVPVDRVELMSDLLWGLGVAAIEERNLASTAYRGPNGHDSVELWTSLGDEETLTLSALQKIGLPISSGPQHGFESWWRKEFVEDDLVNSWKEFAQPIEILNDLWIIPDWIDHHSAAEIPADALLIRIDPGSTFGMGDHPTTRLSLELLVSQLQPGDHVVDLGCGSGILGITALAAGAGYITALDISPAAVEATMANAISNGCAEKIDVSMTPFSMLVERDLPLWQKGQPPGPVQILVANILAPALIAMSGDMQRVCAPNAKIIISGLLESNCAHVIDAFPDWRIIDQRNFEGWTAILLGHRTEDGN
jgi:ribosomal protein L11 methyltransferase